MYMIKNEVIIVEKFLQKLEAINIHKIGAK